MVEQLQKFLAEAIGHKYSLNGLMRRETVKAIKGIENEVISEDRTFFCSELVAKGFKLLGILENDDTSCT
jgi:hypothetical protein